MFPAPKTGSYLQLYDQLGMQMRSCRGRSLLHLIRDPRVWVQSVGEGGQPSCWGRGSRCESDFGSRMANRRESTPRLCSQGRQGFRTKAAKAAEELSRFSSVQSTPFPRLALEKSRMISTDRRLRPFQWPSCGCVGREWCRLGIVAVW
jgi:hypothetical protein